MEIFIRIGQDAFHHFPLPEDKTEKHSKSWHKGSDFCVNFKDNNKMIHICNSQVSYIIIVHENATKIQSLSYFKNTK